MRNRYKQLTYASDLEDNKSNDGDIEEADYVGPSGKAELISHSVFHACEEDDDEPALCD